MMSTRIKDIVAEGTRVVALAEEQGVPLRLLGGVAVRLRCPEAAQRPELARTYKDIDVAAPRRTACINPGSTYAEGVLDGCIVALRGDKVRNAQIVRG